MHRVPPAASGLDESPLPPKVVQFGQGKVGAIHGNPKGKATSAGNASAEPKAKGKAKANARATCKAPAKFGRKRGSGTSGHLRRPERWRAAFVSKGRVTTRLQQVLFFHPGGGCLVPCTCCWTVERSRMNTSQVEPQLRTTCMSSHHQMCGPHHGITS